MIGKGIKLSTGFDLNSQSPLDNREVFETIEERDALPNINLYEGLTCYVKETKENYQYIDGNWSTKSGGIERISYGDTEPSNDDILLWIDTNEESLSNSLTDELIIEFRTSISNMKNTIDVLTNEVNLLEEAVNTITSSGGDGHTHDNKTVLDTITESLISTWNNKSDFSGNYNDLTNKPSIPKLDGYATQTYVANAIANAQLSGGEVDLSGYATKDDLHTHNNKTVLDGITATKVTSWDNKSNFSGSYNDLTNKPSIPTQTSQLTNDSGFLTSIPSEYITETELASKGYLTEHQSLSGYATQSYVNTKIKGLTTLDDVKTNLLGGKIHIYLTQAQYDALSDTEKNDNEKIYHITDKDDEIGNLSSLLTTNKTNLVQAINELYQLIGSGGSGGDTTVAVQSVSLDKTTATLNVGNSITLTATITPSNATNKTVTWSCDNGNVTLNNNGLTCTIVGATVGTSVVTVTADGNKIATCTITVNSSSSSGDGGDTSVAVQGISLNKNNALLNVDNSITLTATITPSNATNKTVTWSCSNSNVTLNSDNLTCTVIGVTAGNSMVTARTADGSKTAICTITVNSSSSSGDGGDTGDYSTILEAPALVNAVDDGNYDVGYFNEGTLNLPGSYGAIFYLSPDGSDTNGNGTDLFPWKSINKVRTHVDTLGSDAYSKVTILMADGNYKVTTTQIIKGTTFGTDSCPVEIRGIGNKAKITTGTKLKNYTQTTMNGETCYMYDLSSLDGWNSGNNIFEPTKEDAVPDYDQSKDNKYQCNITDMPFVSVNGEKLWLASYPNKQDLVFQDGVSGSDNGAIGFSNSQTVVIPSGTLRTKLDSFSQLSNISSTNNKIFVQMYWSGKHSSETLLVRGYSSSSGTLTTSIGCLNEGASPSSSQKFKFFNVKEQLNEESTYWIDYDNNKLYIIPPIGTDMSTAEVVLSHIKNSTTASENTLIATNSASQTYVTFERINFCDHRGNVFLGTSSNKLSGVNFYKCRFANIGRSVFGCNTTYGHYAGTKDTGIVTTCEWRKCKFGNIGEFALFIVGTNRNSINLYSDSNKVYNCVFNRIANTGTYLCNKVHAIYYYGCGMEVKGNKFANHPGTVISWRANDFIIYDNIFYQNTWSEADAGTIYSGCDWSLRGVQIANNKFYAGYQIDRKIGSDYSGTVAIYLDDLYSSAMVINNYIEGYQKGILMGGGRDNYIEVNTMKDCGQGLIADGRGLIWDISNFSSNMTFTNSVPWSKWTSKYPALGTLSSDINNNVKPYGNTIVDNTCSGCYYNINIDSQVSSLGNVSGNTDD